MVKSESLVNAQRNSLAWIRTYHFRSESGQAVDLTVNRSDRLLPMLATVFAACHVSRHEAANFLMQARRTRDHNLYAVYDKPITITRSISRRVGDGWEYPDSN
jgi:hypothetical protein